MGKIRLVVVDESPVTRDSIRSAMAEAADIELLALAPTALGGLARAEQGAADLMLVSSDIEDVPLTTLVRQAQKLPTQPGVLITCVDTQVGAERVIQALEAGAIDFLTKPNAQKPELWQQVFLRRALPKIRSISIARYTRRARSTSASRAGARASLSPKPVDEGSKRPFRAGGGAELVVVGVSTGGPEALSALFKGFPANFPVPIVTVIHLPQQFTESLARVLDRSSRLAVKVVETGECVERGRIYLSPGGVHLAVERATRRRLRVVTQDTPPEGGCKPSVNVLFESVAKVCRGAVVAVIMTGMGNDGVRGLTRLKERGGYALAQDEETSVVWGMPGSVVRAGLADEVVPLDRLARRIIRSVENR